MTESGERWFIKLPESDAKTLAEHADRLVTTAGDDPVSRRAAVQCRTALMQCTAVRPAGESHRSVVKEMCTATAPWTQPSHWHELFASFAGDTNEKGNIKTASYKEAASYVAKSLPNAKYSDEKMSSDAAKKLIGVREKFAIGTGSNWLKKLRAREFQKTFDKKLSKFPEYKSALSAHLANPGVLTTKL
ncbi:hypothetical protein RO07_16925 [Pandoraea pulmonicola]|nr:hypothetical protein RO07_16925 [Pandoraea pulmonicola]